MPTVFFALAVFNAPEVAEAPEDTVAVHTEHTHGGIGKFVPRVMRMTVWETT